MNAELKMNSSPPKCACRFAAIYFYNLLQSTESSLQAYVLLSTERAIGADAYIYHFVIKMTPHFAQQQQQQNNNLNAKS